jgi:hypothetical protein
MPDIYELRERLRRAQDLLENRAPQQRPNSRFQPVPLDEFLSVFQPAGFQPSMSGREIVLVRSHERDPDLLIKIYTSIQSGQEESRDSGEDAIRVCLVYKGKGRGKTKRVNRVGDPKSTVLRALDRARDMWRLGKTIDLG